jgi:hypothetical protein
VLLNEANAAAMAQAIENGSPRGGASARDANRPGSMLGSRRYGARFAYALTKRRQAYALTKRRQAPLLFAGNDFAQTDVERVTLA